MKRRRDWISTEEPIPIARQCEIAGTNRSTYYLKPAIHLVDAEELKLLELIDQEFTRHPFYGSRRMTHSLRRQDYRINRKRVQRLMLKPGLAGIMANPKASEPHPEHKVFPKGSCLAIVEHHGQCVLCVLPAGSVQQVRNTGNPSIRIKALSLPARLSSALSGNILTSASAWMVEAERWTTFLLKGYGAASSMKICI